MPTLLTALIALLLTSGDPPPVALVAPAEDEPLLVVVMDPLSAPLSCPCVAGYAQRRYDKLAEHLQAKTGRTVQIEWAQALQSGLEAFAARELPARADLIIGKDSQVRFDAKGAELEITPVAHLTGKDGSTQQHGLIVVRTQDSAQKLADLAGYHILYGQEDCAEKFAAARKLLKSEGLALENKPECQPSCSAAAGALLELPATTRAAAVVSSYAQPLLEGCGTVPKGALRVLGRTEDVPFITAFVGTHVEEELRQSITDALLSVGRSPFLMLALETKKGFVAAPEVQKKVSPKGEEAGTTAR